MLTLCIQHRKVLEFPLCDQPMHTIIQLGLTVVVVGW
jgi:hypothetical protein